MRAVTGFQGIHPFAVVVMGALLLVTGCKPRDAYAPPVTTNPLETASIIGSRVEVPSIAEDIRLIVTAVDGRMTGVGRSEWDHPLVISPGSHLVQIAAVQGQIRGEVAVRATLEANKTYRAVYERRDDSEPGQIWLEDQQTGLPICDKLIVFGATHYWHTY